jgi:hypothetical protein
VVTSARSDAPSSVRQLQEASKAVAGAAGNVAADRVRTEVAARSSRAAVELKAFAIAARASASSLREQGHSNEAEMVERGAGRADRLAAYLGTASADELVEDARRFSREAAAFARREPMLVMAGGFAVGLLIPKVLDALGNRQASNQSSTRSRSTSGRKKSVPRTTPEGESA